MLNTALLAVLYLQPTLTLVLHNSRALVQLKQYVAMGMCVLCVCVSVCVFVPSILPAGLHLAGSVGTPAEVTQKGVQSSEFTAVRTIRNVFFFSQPTFCFPCLPLLRFL